MSLGYPKNDGVAQKQYVVPELRVFEALFSATQRGMSIPDQDSL